MDSKKLIASGIQYPRADHPLCDALLRMVDAGLVGIICVAPFFFGGRHDMGRLVLVALVAVTAAAWFARQAMLCAARPLAGWPRTAAHVILLLAVALLVVQIVPLPPDWLARLAPGTAELLPLWSVAGDAPANLGAWQTISLTPHETTKSLAMLLSYSLLFIVVAGRIRQSEDAHRLLTCVGAAAVLMAGFGVVQHFTSDGRFFWFYAHPHRSTANTLSGAFLNRNHFAAFLVLGVGPLVALLLRQAAACAAADAAGKAKPGRRPFVAGAQQLAIWAVAAALALVVFTILLSRSRGGAVALLVAAAVLVTIYCVRRVVDSRILYALAGLVIVVVGLLSLHGYDQVARRLGDFTEGSIDEIDRGGGRRTIWAANAAAFQAHPLFGAGAGSHREVAPVYLRESTIDEFTHAENGYLQVATENGTLGVVLLAAGIGVLGGWCLTCLRRATTPDDVRLFGAAAAGLAAGLVHSAFDFVWYIPACMSVTIVLAACVLRLSQLAQASEAHPNGLRVLPRARWVELMAAAVLVGGWSVYAYLGPAVAAIHWDRYLAASAASSRLAQQQAYELVVNRPASTAIDHQAMNDLMIRHLEQAVRWDSNFGRARLRLAAKYLARFELLQQNAENAMGVGQIRDAAIAASFNSQAELEQWLDRAFGGNVAWLRRAADEARLAAALSPLQGEAYLYLADLCFLDGGDLAAADACRNQALLVRPCDGEVLFEVGKQELLRGDIDSAIARWQKCFAASGLHQRSIIYLLAGRIPAPMFVETFQPDWRTLREVWARYRGSEDPRDLESLLVYAAERAAIETQVPGGIPPANIWFWQSSLYTELRRDAEALACLERAYACDPRNYQIRYALARGLERAGRFAEAEPHVRWCLARQPTDKVLAATLVNINKHRHARREASHGTTMTR